MIKLLIVSFTLCSKFEPLDELLILGGIKY